jgi:hypothetical protein
MSPVLADCVAKVTEQVLWNWNLKQSNRGAFTFESTFPVRAIAAVFAASAASSGSDHRGKRPVICKLKKRRVLIDPARLPGSQRLPKRPNDANLSLQSSDHLSFS